MRKPLPFSLRSRKTTVLLFHTHFCITFHAHVIPYFHTRWPNRFVLHTWRSGHVTTANTRIDGSATHAHIYCTYQRHMSAHFVRRPGASCIYARNPPDVEGGGGKSSNGVTRATWRGQLAVLLMWGDDTVSNHVLILCRSVGNPQGFFYKE